MSTSIKNLRQLAARDVKDHTAIFDSYVVLGRDIDYLAIKFGLDPENIVNLLEGYGNDNPGSKSQGMKQLMAGGGVALVGITLIPLLSGLFG